MKKISIIIRAKNEERWITSCLKAVFSQTVKDIEVLVVDNNSTDNTIDKAKKFNVKIFNIDTYTPGGALNFGIHNSSGEFIVSLSAHCIPKDNQWLANLLKNFERQDVAGVYGRQCPMHFTSDIDKRDLYLVFGMDKRVQEKDSFFHNANSMIRRSVWKENPYDEKVKNIEDRVWGQEIINKGYKIVYEPEAVVFHHHGIHQSLDIDRCKSIVSIMESLSGQNFVEQMDFESLLKDLKIVGMITVKGEMQCLAGNPLIKYTLDRVKQSQLLSEVIVASDNEELLKYCKKEGVKTTFLRPVEFSKPDIGIEPVMQYALKKYEDSACSSADIVVYLGIQSVFRPRGLIDDLIRLLFRTGFDSVVPGSPTYKSCWINEDEQLKRVDEGFLPRGIKKPIHVGYPGLACVTMAEFIRNGHLLGNKVQILEVLDIYSTIEIKDQASSQLVEKIFPDWWKENL